MSTPRRQAGFFFNIWHSPDKRWTKIFSPVTDCPEIDPDYLEMQKAADPIKYRHYSEWKIIPSGKPGNRSTARQTGRRSGPDSE